MLRACAARWTSSGGRWGYWDGFCDRHSEIRKGDYEIMDDQKNERKEETRKGARLKVIGIGGGGSNAVGRMYEEGLDGVEFYVMNTDAQALGAAKVPNK